MANLQVGVAGNGTVTVGAGASVHSPASNILTLGTNGDERIRIAADGKVGIGEDVPTQKLHLHEATSGGNFIQFTNSTTGETGNDGCLFGINSDEGGTIWHQESNYIRFGTNDTERLLIESGGRVNIVGICSVASNVQVGGDVDNSTNTQGIALQTGGKIRSRVANTSSDAYIVSVQNDGASKILFSGAGNGYFADGIRVATAATISTNGNITAGIVTSTAFVPSEGQLGRKNMLINGDCRVAQRGASVTTGTGNFAAYTLDQWKASAYATDQLNLTVTQEPMNQAIPGLANFIKVSPNAAESGGAADEYAHIRQSIEAKDCQRLKWGTASAESATLSFWVKSNTTGTACICFNKNDATSYYITRTYTINAADTWEYKTVTIPGLTPSGIANDTGIGINIIWFLDAGSNYKTTDSTSWVTTADGKFAYGHNINLIDSTSDYLALAGVQFEVGTVDTPFEHLAYSEELALCQRYYQLGIMDGVVKGTSSSTVHGRVNFQQTMRAEPTLGKTSGDFKIGDMISWSTTADATVNNSGYKTWGVSQGVSLSGFGNVFTTGGIYRHENNSSQAVFTLSAEL